MEKLGGEKGFSDWGIVRLGVWEERVCWGRGGFRGDTGWGVTWSRRHALEFLAKVQFSAPSFSLLLGGVAVCDPVCECEPFQRWGWCKAFQGRWGQNPCTAFKRRGENIFCLPLSSFSDSQIGKILTAAEFLISTSKFILPLEEVSSVVGQHLESRKQWFVGYKHTTWFQVIGAAVECLPTWLRAVRRNSYLLHVFWEKGDTRPWLYE